MHPGHITGYSTGHDPGPDRACLVLSLLFHREEDFKAPGKVRPRNNRRAHGAGDRQQQLCQGVESVAIVKIDGVVQVRLKNGAEIDPHRVDREISVQKIDAIAKGVQRQDLKPLYHSGFF